MKTIRKHTIQVTAGLALAGWLALSTGVQAQPSAHYVPGVEGIKGASLPPPGLYLRDYNVFYFAGEMNNANGSKIDGLDVDAFIYANVPRLIWITEKRVLGGYLGVDALLPLQNTDLDISAGPNSVIDERTFGVGDLFFEGTWSKHWKQVDLSLGYGVYAPIGDSAKPPTSSAGSGFWTHMFTAGATWYIDSAKKWAISALNRYEINGENHNTDITPGQVYTLEWGASYGVTKTVDVGVVGYYQQQVTGDYGTGASDNYDRVAAIGPEVSVFYPESTFGWSLRYLYEFGARDRLKGHTVALTLTKRF